MNDFLTRVKRELEEMPPVSEMIVGLSGGVDSVLLLHSLKLLHTELPFNTALRAVHVNHGLHGDAGRWQQFCVGLCADLDIPLCTETVKVRLKGSLESAAREARYGVFSKVLKGGGALMLAQHLDDQLETMLLRLMRGAGPSGLAGMPRCRPQGAGIIYRPFLKITREEILKQARLESLEWVEDPSNEDTDLDRNFLRHRILPVIAERWPSYRMSWIKSGELLREADELLGAMATEDLQRLGSHDGAGLHLDQLLDLTDSRRRNLLRHWLALLGVAEPGWHQLQGLCRELSRERERNAASFEIAGISLQQHDGYLYAVKAVAPPETIDLRWNAIMKPLLALPGNGQLQARKRHGRGLGLDYTDNLELRYRTGGESIRLPNRPAKSLKKLLQEEGMAPWLRFRLPLLYREDRLVCVPGIGPLEECAAGPEEEGVLIDWHAPDCVLRPN